MKISDTIPAFVCAKLDYSSQKYSAVCAAPGEITITLEAPAHAAQTSRYIAQT